jgi:putative flippase GtrA
MRARRELFLRFACVGVVGFVVDASAVALLVRLLGVGPYQARLGSYFCAVTVTWWLNRQFTFASKGAPFPEFLKFVATNAFGATINLLVYAVLIYWRGTDGWMPVIAVGAGSIAGLFTNFALSSRLVFHRA